MELATVGRVHLPRKETWERRIRITYPSRPSKKPEPTTIYTYNEIPIAPDPRSCQLLLLHFERRGCGIDGGRVDESLFQRRRKRFVLLEKLRKVGREPFISVPAGITSDNAFEYV